MFKTIILGTLALMAAVITFVQISEGTFGQRCGRPFPNDLQEQDRCVFEMANGERDYPTQRKDHP